MPSSKATCIFFINFHREMHFSSFFRVYIRYRSNVVKMSFINRKYKDSVFTDLFGSDRDGKKNFLELYNGLSGSNYKLEEVTLERKVIEQSLYKTYNNDVSWEIDGKLIVLVEHQSTINENMPFRCLEYVTRIYEGIFPQNKRYAENVCKIPNPDFYVVYVGKKDLPLEQELRLSDAFYKKDSSSLELVVKVRNCTNPRMLPIAKDCDIHLQQKIPKTLLQKGNR